MAAAVIFDCDGVLVDSEVVAHAVEMAVLTEIGLIYDSAAFKARFMGMSDKAFNAALDEDAIERLGRPITAEIQPIMQARYLERIALVGEVPGAGQAVGALGMRPKAVASSSGITSLTSKLKRTSLWDHFAPHVYSADHVEHAKPAPDLFLHAAEKLGIAPAGCLVLEDSVNGVRAAMAAGMDVWGFTGGGHMDEGMTARLTEAGATRIVRDWNEAAVLFARL
jgi:beta-phosphoglucomutase-like phosphatase (HAD superfamily)